MEDCVRNLLNDIAAYRNKFNFTAVVAMDIKGAFDNIVWSHLLAELRRYEFPDYLREVICSFLENRVVTSGNTRLQLNRGCPQGSVLGPILWNLAYNYALEHFTEASVMASCYADDIAYVIGANNRRRLVDKINSLLDEVTVVLSEGGLELSAEKTEVMVLNGGVIHDMPPKCIQYCEPGRRMKFVTCIKYLGMMLDDRLTWNQHVEYLIEKSSVMLPKMLAVATNTYGYSNNARYATEDDRSLLVVLC